MRKKICFDQWEALEELAAEKVVQLLITRAVDHQISLFELKKHYLLKKYNWYLGQLIWIRSWDKFVCLFSRSLFKNGKNQVMFLLQRRILGLWCDISTCYEHLVQKQSWKISWKYLGNMRKSRGKLKPVVIPSVNFDFNVKFYI